MRRYNQRVKYELLVERLFLGNSSQHTLRLSRHIATERWMGHMSDIVGKALHGNPFHRRPLVRSHIKINQS
jgi:hypothetical protein